MATGIVVDTNVVACALRSRRGASYQSLTRVGSGAFDISLSVPLFLEYEQILKRLAGQGPLTVADIDSVLDYLCRLATHHRVFYLWRPFLKDPKDDMVLELAVAANCSHIVTFNTRDFAGAEQFGVRIATPHEFLQSIGELP